MIKILLSSILLFLISYSFAGASPNSDLLSGAEGCDIPYMQKALARGANINAKDRRGSTALIIASSYHCPEAVRFLLKRGAKVNIHPKGKYSALLAATQRASMFNQMETFKILVDAGAEINYIGYENKNVIWLLAQRGQSDKLIYPIIEYLIKKGANIHVRDSHIGYNPLMVAVENKNPAIARLLWSLGADPKVRGDQGETLIMLAAYRNYVEFIKRALKSGVDINARTKNGWTALTYAVRHNCYSAAKYLVEKGININARTTDIGQTAVFCNIVERSTHHSEKEIENRLNILKLLVENGADLNVRDKYGKTVLYYAIMYGDNKYRKYNIDIVDYLIKNGASIKAVKKRGMNALAAAAMSGKTEFVYRFYKNGCRIDFMDRYGENLLHHALNDNLNELADFLLKKDDGQLLNEKGKMGWTPLMYAVERGRLEQVKIILKYNPDTSIKNDRGKTALQMAREKGNKEIIRLLSK